MPDRLPCRWSSYPHYTDRITYRRDFGILIIQTELPRRWLSARFWYPNHTNRINSPMIIARFRYLHYTDRITSWMIIGEIFASSLYRQNYLADDYRREFGILIIQRELPRRWSSARFWLILIIQTELPRRWSSARFWVHPYYTDGITSPMINGEILVHPYYTDGITSKIDYHIC